MHMFGHHYVGENIKVQPLTGLVESVQKEIGTTRIEEDRCAAVARESERVSMPLFVDADPSHL